MSITNKRYFGKIKTKYIYLWASSFALLFFFSFESLPPVPSLSFVAVGDIMLSRVVEQKMMQKNLSYPFSQTKEYLSSADITFANLESPLINGRIIKTGEYTFRAPEDVAPVLKETGFDVLSLANNHILNFGQKGLTTTVDTLKKADIQGSGIGDKDTVYTPQYIQRNGITLALLSFASPTFTDIYEPRKELGVALMDISKMTASVQEAKKNADVVIVSMHAGTEYSTKPTQEQTSFAQASIDAGADMVLGHHPHVIQEMEEYKGKPIFYSLGNFVFDQMWSTPTRQGLLINANLTKQGVKKITCKGVRIQDYAVPEFVSKEEIESWVKPLDPDGLCDTFEGS